jgi:hypothetical protein
MLGEKIIGIPNFHSEVWSAKRIFFFNPPYLMVKAWRIERKTSFGPP